MSRDASSTSWSKRGLLRGAGLLLPLGSLLGACGFRPLYAPVTDAAGGESDLREELAAVRIADIPERSGQLLRRSLQRRFEGSAPGTPARYNLLVALGYTVEPLGYRQDGTITRVRYIISGNWTLTTLSVPPQRVAVSAIPYRALDSFNIPDLQFFSADTSRDAMDARLVEQVSEEIYRRVSMELRSRRAAQPA